MRLRPIDSAEPATQPLQVPITELYIETYTAFFKRHGCVVASAGYSRNNAQVFWIELPAGTTKQRQMQAHDSRYVITFPDGTQMEEVQVVYDELCHSLLFLDPSI